MSRTDYKPINPHNLDDPFKGEDGTFMDVKDFHSGKELRFYQSFQQLSCLF